MRSLRRCLPFSLKGRAGLPIHAAALFGALLAILPSVPRSAASSLPAPASAPMPGVKGADYTFRSTQFRMQDDSAEVRDRSLKPNLTIPPGSTEAVFISEPVVAPFGFSDVVPSWVAEEPLGTAVQVELRTSSNGTAWGDWLRTDLEDMEMPQDSPERTWANIVPVPQDARVHRQAQARVTLRADRAGTSPIFRELTYTFIDAGVTPNPPRGTLMIQGTPADVPKPLMVSRSDWGSPQGEASPKWKPKFKRTTHIVIHHTATTNNDTDHAARVRAIWYYHTYTRGWGDVGYNYMIDPNGVIYEGRAGGDDVEAGHAYPFNTGTMGIGVLGNFMTVAPSAAAQAALIDLISWKVSQRGIDPLATEPITGYTNCGGKITYHRPTIASHRDYLGTACGRVFNKTTCPGDRLWDMLPQLRESILADQPPLRATFLKHDTPGNLEPGGTIEVQLTLRNSGSLEWPAGGQGAVSVGYHWRMPDGKPVPGGAIEVTSPLPYNVRFAQNVTMPARLIAPKTPGHYVLRWDLVRDGEGWFSELGSRALQVDVVVGRSLGDKQAPKSSVLPLPSYLNSSEVPVRWAGEDEPRGSGLVSYDIQYRVAPTGEWTDWQSANAQTQATFDADDGFTYEFRSRARDAAGNLEEWPERAQAYTTIDTRPPLLIVDSPADDSYVQPGSLAVTGKTEPGAFVAVNDARAQEVGGVFTATIPVEGRDFMIHITAADPAGNVSRSELTVQAAPRFTDVPMDHAAFAAVEELSSNGIVMGYQDSTFRPDVQITRAHVAKLVVLSQRWGLITPQESRYVDVAPSDWSFAFVETVSARHVMSGFYDGTFQPHVSISRGLLLRTFVQMAGWRLERPRRDPASDVDRLGSFAPYLEAARAHGIVVVDDDGAFNPYSPATRADAAQMLYLVRRAVSNKGDIETPPDYVDFGPQQ